MRCSLNEIETSLRRASVGVGLPVGLAEEVAAAGRWLSGVGRDGPGAALVVLWLGAPDHAAPVETGARTVTLAAGQVALNGPAAIDFLLADDGMRIHLARVDAPLLLAGMVGVAAASHGREFLLELTGHASVRITGAGMTPPDAPMAGPCDAVLSCVAAGVPLTGGPTGGANVDDATWVEVQALAARTYVPETAQSRQGGAGAGLTDND